MSAKPQVWNTCTVNGKNGELKLKIMDLPEERLQECKDLFTNFLSREETFHKVSGVIENETAFQQTLKAFEDILENSVITICCIDDGSDNGGKIIAASAISLAKKDDPEYSLQDIEGWLKSKGAPPESVKLVKMAKTVSGMYNVLKQFEIDCYYEGKGLVVHPDYRGCAIAQKLLRVRRHICTRDGVPLTGVLLSAFGSQKAAEYDGWETIFELPSEVLEKQFDVSFKGYPPTLKYMIAKPLPNSL